MARTYDFQDIAERREEGHSWRQIGNYYRRSADAVRMAFSRWEDRQPEQDPVPDLLPPSQTEGMKVLGIDIETAPNMAYVWGAYKQNVHQEQMIQTGRVMCFAYRWYSDPDSVPSFVSEHSHGHEAMVNAAWALLHEADAVVHYNGNKFDVPTLNREFVKYGLTPPAPYKQIDLLRVARKEFRFFTNRLDNVLRELDLGQKVKNDGFMLWVECMAGDEDAWRRMEEYNLADVTEMEKLYRRLLPWISTHPNHALYQNTDGPTCPNCGSNNVHRRGTARTKTQLYQRYQCQDCGRWNRERYTQVDPDKRRHILTQEN